MLTNGGGADENAGGIDGWERAREALYAVAELQKEVNAPKLRWSARPGRRVCPGKRSRCAWGSTSRLSTANTANSSSGSPPGHLSSQAEGGDEIFVELEPDAVEGIAVCGGEPCGFRRSVCQGQLQAARVADVPRQHCCQAAFQAPGTSTPESTFGTPARPSRPECHPAGDRPRVPAAGSCCRRPQRRCSGRQSPSALFRRRYGPRRCSAPLPKPFSFSPTRDGERPAPATHEC